MSYARFSPFSDVYIFHHCAGYLSCCGCQFETVYLDEPEVDMFGIEWDVQVNDFKAYTPQAMLDHIKKHRRAGHKVPTRVARRIKAEYPDLTVKIEEHTIERKRKLVLDEEGNAHYTDI